MFDPIAELGLRCGFYPLNHRLEIDLPRLQTALEESPVNVLVIAGSFG